MMIKEIFKIYNFIKNNRGCIILKDDLEIGLFGKISDQLMHFYDVIMNTSVLSYKDIADSLESLSQKYRAKAAKG